MLREPALIPHELARAPMGAWLPQALPARRQTLRDVLAQLERQQARLLDVSLAEVIELTFRTLFRTAEAILAEPLVERGAGARYRLCHAL